MLYLIIAITVTSFAALAVWPVETGR